MADLGFIGLGIMGRGMASNLIASGHRPLVWNRTPSRYEGIDAHRADSPRDLGARSEIVFVCVSDSPDVEEVVFGPQGAIHEMAPGAVIVDHSTISPAATQDFSARAAERGVAWVDAPVSGGSEGAERGTLAVMAGGPAEALERARPYMEAYSKSIVHIGEEPGSGQTAKAVNQVLVVINALAVSEGLLLADAAGLDLQTTLSAVEGGAAGSWMLSNRGPQVIQRDWRPGFTIDLQVKDLRIALEEADRLGVPMPGLALVFQLYKALQNRGLGSEGNHALIKALEEMADRKVGSAE
ncbi:MAG: NAD(P)-dependent oxidoreductase [Actinomycetes bacterium]|jgi:3-hydroxyisobutyrate dehydrogenase|nr:MAG: 2-hydroxy-3-oxopropionate reductase [Actinomycetota bacterium]